MVLRSLMQSGDVRISRKATIRLLTSLTVRVRADVAGGRGERRLGPLGKSDTQSLPVVIKLDFLPESEGVRSEYHAAADMVISSMLARASAGVR